MIKGRLVRVHDDTYNQLLRLGRMGKSFEDVISELVKERLQTQQEPQSKV